MKKTVCFLIGIGCMLATFANNIQVSGITVSQPNITFTISWDNSWNTMSNINPLYPNNWDGAWVFIKYQNPIDNLWKHATVSSSAGDHSVTGGVLQVEPVTDGMGVFIRRTNPGNGTVSATVTLKMNALVGTGSFNFKVFGTEVVYIPQAQFQLGDGNTTAQYFTAQDITSVKQTSGIAAGAIYSGSPAVPASYPMGYNAMYMMKYEITVEQWADFLNTLTYDQQAARIEAAPNAAAGSFAYFNPGGNSNIDNIIRIQAPGLNNTSPATFACDANTNGVYNEASDGQTVAWSYLSKADFYSFLDWSGLRPMTEMEFEKACRGTLPRVINEYPWGTTDWVARFRLGAGVTGQGTTSEGYTGVVTNGPVVTGSNVNATYGPMRVGQFATASSGRASSGAGFYGNMDLAGNAWELCVFTDALGLTFTGINGNGTLNTAGEGDVANWPSGSTAAATATTYRGGSWVEVPGSSVEYTKTSYREGGIPAGRSINYGGRGVRSMP